MLFDVDYDTLGYFILATILLIVTPGPIVSLVIAETLKHGPHFGLAVIFGAEVMAIIALSLFYLGFAAVTHALADNFDYIRYIGATYLIYLAVRSWFDGKSNTANSSPHISRIRTPLHAFRNAVTVAALNPKALIFYAAFFPQFIDASRPLGPQMFILTLAFLATSFVFDGFWLLSAHQARKWLLAKNARSMINRISASALALGSIVLIFIG